MGFDDHVIADETERRVSSYFPGETDPLVFREGSIDSVHDQEIRRAELSKELFRAPIHWTLRINVIGNVDNDDHQNV